MKTGDDISVLNLGWECTRQARRILSAAGVHSLNTSQVLAAGRDMDQLAYELRQRQHISAARLAYSVAFVLNSLVGETMSLDTELAEKTSQIVQVLAEMLLELEATTQIRAQEPIALVEEMKQNWGVDFEPENSVTESPEGSDAAADLHDQAQASVLKELRDISDTMVGATESLMERILHRHDFPYAPALTRIHHLAVTIRDVAAASTAESTLSSTSEITCEEILADQLDQIIEEGNLVAESCCEEFEGRVRASIDQTLDGPPILLIDESPFFRMLLTSAIEATGRTVLAVAKLEDVPSNTDLVSVRLVIYGAISEAQSLDDLRTWLDGRGIGDSPMIALRNSVCELELTGCQQIRRTDLPGLLAAINVHLAFESFESRLIA